MICQTSRRAALLGLVTALACESGPVTAPDSPAFGSVRDRSAQYDGLEISLESAWVGWGIGPLPAPRLDAVGLRVFNGSPGARRFDPRTVRVETTDGAYWPRVVVGTEPELRPLFLGPAEDRFGWIVFRVPAAAEPIAVVWTPAPGLALRIALPGPVK